MLVHHSSVEPLCIFIYVFYLISLSDDSPRISQLHLTPHGLFGLRQSQVLGERDQYRRAVELRAVSSTAIKVLVMMKGPLVDIADLRHIPSISDVS